MRADRAGGAAGRSALRHGAEARRARGPARPPAARGAAGAHRGRSGRRTSASGCPARRRARSRTCSIIRRWPPRASWRASSTRGWDATAAWRIRCASATARRPRPSPRRSSVSTRARSWRASGTPTRRSSGCSARGRWSDRGRPRSCAASSSCPRRGPELFAKALAGAADALSFDLEDAVQESTEGRGARDPGGIPAPGLRAAARQDPHRAGERAGDAALRGRSPRRWRGRAVDMINLPKPESAEDVRAAAAALARMEAERADRTPHRHPRQRRIAARAAAARSRSRRRTRAWSGSSSGWAISSSPSASTARTTARSTPPSSPCAWPRRRPAIWACDTVYGTVADPEGFTREAEAARRLGFIGKSCIHPTQVPLANAVFRPTEAEIAAALRVVEAARGAERNGVGRVPGGRPHDRHPLRQARRVDPRRGPPARPGSRRPRGLTLRSRSGARRDRAPARALAARRRRSHPPRAGAAAPRAPNR